MEAIKRQASKFREQVAKQQQAFLRQLDKEAAIFDEEELQCHQKLQDLYNSTRVSKHYQKDIVHGIDGFVSTSKKQMEIAKKLAEDCCKYGTENQAAFPLARAAEDFGTSHACIEERRETMLSVLAGEVSEPLRALIRGAPLEDARHLAHRCERLRQEVEAQAVEVLRRQSKCRDPSAESVLKLKRSEAKLDELRSSMRALQREAISAMLSVEEQQQRLTSQKLLTIVDAERSYHRKVVTILEELHAEMILEMRLQESSSMETSIHPQHGDDTQNGLDETVYKSRSDFFIGKVIHSFDAQTDGELSLSVDDFVVVRQVTPNGWSEGECMGKAGWFPSAYVERQDEAPANKIPEKADSLG